MLPTGTTAPDFTLPNDRGEETFLSDLLAAGPLILYFYPADFTPGCTKEACAIRDLHDDVVSAGLQVVGISPQDPESHARFREQHNLPFILLSDPDKKVIRLYGVEGPFGIGVRRATYLIDGSGRIQAGLLADLRIGRHKEFIRRAISVKQADRGAG
jgi:thioredoxin-dependent peroxiredoxin